MVFCYNRLTDVSSNKRWWHAEFTAGCCVHLLIKSHIPIANLVFYSLKHRPACNSEYSVQSQMFSGLTCSPLKIDELYTKHNVKHCYPSHTFICLPGNVGNFTKERVWTTDKTRVCMFSSSVSFMRQVGIILEILANRERGWWFFLCLVLIIILME